MQSATPANSEQPVPSRCLPSHPATPVAQLCPREAKFSTFGAAQRPVACILQGLVLVGHEIILGSCKQQFLFSFVLYTQEK